MPANFPQIQSETLPTKQHASQEIESKTSSLTCYLGAVAIGSK